MVRCELGNKAAVYPPGQRAESAGSGATETSTGAQKHLPRKENRTSSIRQGKRESLEPQVLSGFFAPFWPTKKGLARRRNLL